jgi:dihydroneopterin aldolase
MTTPQVKLVHTPRIADGRARVRHVFVHDLVVRCRIGVHDHERGADQRVRVNLDLAVYEGDKALDDDIRNVVCYEKLAAGVREVAEQGHMNLVETFAEEIAAMCLAKKQVRSARVRVEKLDVLGDADSVGVEIERFSAGA